MTSSSAQPETPRTVAALLGLVDTTWSPVEAAFVLDDARLTGAGDGWSIKDQLAHITAWERALLATLDGVSWQAAVAGAGIADPPTDVDALNAIVFEREQARPAAAVIEDARTTHARLRARLAALTDADLARPNGSFDPGLEVSFRDEPIITWIAANTYGHYPEHAGAITSMMDHGNRR